MPARLNAATVSSAGHPVSILVKAQPKADLHAQINALPALSQMIGHGAPTLQTHGFAAFLAPSGLGAQQARPALLGLIAVPELMSSNREFLAGFAGAENFSVMETAASRLGRYADQNPTAAVSKELRQIRDIVAQAGGAEEIGQRIAVLLDNSQTRQRADSVATAADSSGAALQPALAPPQGKEDGALHRAGAYVWTAPKREASFEGRYEYHFQNARSVSHLPAAVEKLTTMPWYRIYTEPFGPFDKRVASLESQPALQLHVVDIDQMTVYHETRFAAISEIVKEQAPRPFLQGRLDAPRIKMTNPGIEPAFYTSADHMSGFMLDRPEELLLKIRLKPRENVTLLSLVQPLTEPEKSRLLELLTGKADYWAGFKARYETKSEKDFDLFQSAVVRALREVHGVSADVMLYTQDFTETIFGRETRLVYAWPIFYNREILRGSTVERVYSLPFSHQHSRKPGVNDELYAPVSRQFVDRMVKTPSLHEIIKVWATSTPYYPLQQQLEVPQEKFWSDYFPTFQKYLVGEGFSTLSRELDATPGLNEEQIQHLIGDLFLEYARTRR